MNMVSLMGGKVTTDLYVKPTDSQPSISPLLMSPNPHQREIPYNPGSFARICSDPNSFDRRCNDLEKLLIERGYSEREAQKQILRARGFSRDSLVLCWIKEINQPARVEQNKMKITFNLTYYAVFQNIKKILAELATSFAYP